MISVLSPTNRYILQPSLTDMHHQSLDWISATELWKKEVIFFQKVLDQHALKSESTTYKKQVDHFQHLITYYRGELIDALRKMLVQHEGRLAAMLQQLNESDTEYYKEHAGIMEQLLSFNKTFNDFKHQFFNFIEHGFSPYLESLGTGR